MEELAKALGGIIAATGIGGAIAIGVVVGLVLAVIILGRTNGLFAEARGAFQQTTFQATLLDTVKSMREIERSLRDELEELRDEKGRLQHALTEATVSIELMRAQQRRIIDLFRDVLAGRRPPSSIDPVELGGEA